MILFLKVWERLSQTWFTKSLSLLINNNNNYIIFLYMRKIIKNIVVFIHNLIVLFLVIGFLLPKKYLIYFLIAWPLVYLHWKTNNNRCSLTELEYWLDNKPYPADLSNYDGFHFLKKMVDSFNIDERLQYYIGTYGFNLTWLIGVYRYYNLHF